MTPEEITDEILSLEEPWRSRFLTLIASRATGKRDWGDAMPTREDVVSWLQDLNLRCTVRRMLDAWSSPGYDNRE